MSSISCPQQRFRPLVAIGALILFGATTACQDNNLTGTGSPAAVVQLIDAAPGYPYVNFYINSQLASNAQAYRDNSVFLYVPAGTQTFDVRSYTDTTLLASTQATLGVDTLYTVIFTQSSVNNGIIVLPDTVSAPAAGNAAFRIVNASPGAAGAVDVYMTSVSASLTGLVPLATLPFQGSSLYIPFPAGTVRIRVTAAGNQSSLLLDINPATLSAGQVRTIILLDAPGGGLPMTYTVLGDRG